MANKIIFVAVLILELAGVFSFYVSKGNQQSDIYEIKENLKTHTLTFTNPKPEKPTLREIIYYHIIEKPYDQVKTQNNSLIYKNAEINRKPIEQRNLNDNYGKISHFKGLVEINGENINYITGSTDVTNDKYSILKNYFSKDNNLSVSEKSEALRSTNVDFNNIISEKQTTDNGNNVSKIKNKNTAENHSSTKNIELNDLEADYSSINSDVDPVETKNTSIQEISTDGVEIVDNYSKLNDFYFSNQDVNKIIHSNEKTSENSTLMQKEIKQTVTKNTINSIENTSSLKNNTDTKLSTSYQIPTESETFGGHAELTDIHAKGNETNLKGHNELKENKNNNVKDMETVNVNHKSSFDQTTTLQYKKGGKISHENIKSETNSKTNIIDLNDVNKYTNVKTKETSKIIYDNKTKGNNNNLNINSKQIMNENIENNDDADKTKTNKEGRRSKVTALEHNTDDEIRQKNMTNNNIKLTITNHTHSYDSDVIIINNNYTATNSINIYDITNEINSNNDTQFSKLESHKNEEKNKATNNEDILFQSFHDIDNRINEQRKTFESNVIGEHKINLTVDIDTETAIINYKSSNTSKENGKTTNSSNIEKTDVIGNFDMVQRENRTENSVFTKITNATYDKDILSSMVQKDINASHVYTKDKNKTVEIKVTQNTNTKPKIWVNKSTFGLSIETDLSLANEVTHNIDRNKTSHVKTIIKESNSYYDTYNDKFSDKRHSSEITELYNVGVNTSINQFTQGNESSESVKESTLNNKVVIKSNIDNGVSKIRQNANKTIDQNTKDNTISDIENNKINHVSNFTVTTDSEINNENRIKQKHITEDSNKSNINNKTGTSLNHVYSKSVTEHASNAYHTMSNNNEPVIYVYSDYDNPYDGKEGVNFNARQFINGHGYQYFYPYPDDQTNVVEEINESKNNNATSHIEEHFASSESKDSILGTIVVADDDLDPTEDDKLKLNKSTNKTIDLEKPKKITKRGFRTLMSVHEDMAPEDMYKDVMDKISERVRRSLKEEGETYGMTLTGGRGVVWNDFNRKTTFPVGEHSYDVKNIRDADQGRLRIETNEAENEKKLQNAYNKKDVIELDDKGASDNALYVDGYDINTNNGKNDDLMAARAQANLWSDSNYTRGKSSDSEEDSIDELNEIKIKGDYNNDKYEEKSLEEFNIVKTSDEDYNGHKPQIYEPILSGNTYGINLIGGRGNVWNDINGQNLSYQVGKPTLGQAPEMNKDNEIINSKIAAFQSFLRDGSSSVSEPKPKEPTISEPSTTKFAPGDNSQDRLLVTDKKVSRKPTISINKQTNKQSSKKVPKVLVSIIETPVTETTESKSEFVEQAGQLTGMRLSGNNGLVWNDLNGRRVSYQVGEKATNSAYITKTSGDDKKIDAMTAQFQKSLEQPPSTDKPVTADPISEIPVVIKPLTEEPIISETNPNEPSTKRPTVIGPTNEEVITGSSSDQPPVIVKLTTPKPEGREENTEESYTEDPHNPIETYGMSLTGYHGLVWNDLNGDRISYHVGESVEESKDNGYSQPTTSNATENNKDETTELLNKIDQVLDEIDNILEDMAQEKDNPKEENYKEDLKELIDLIKEVFNKESAKLDDKLNKLNDLNENLSSKDKNENSNLSLSIEELVNNEEFRKWLTDWLSSNTEHLMNQVEEYVKKEVEKQIQEYFTTHNKTESLEIIGEQSAEEDKSEIVDEDVSKKRKDCDNRKDKKESEIKVDASNIYSSSVGNKNVTNVFIFNVNKISDLDNIVTEPLINGTDGVYVFENKEETNKLVDSEEINENTDKDTTEKLNVSENENVTDATSDIVTEKLEPSIVDEMSDNPGSNIEIGNNHSNEIISDKDGDEQKENKSKENMQDSKETITGSKENKDSDNKSNEYGNTQNKETNPNELTSEDSEEPETLEPTSSDESKDNDNKSNEDGDTQNEETNSIEFTSEDSEEPEVNDWTENVPSEAENNEVAENLEQSEESSLSDEKKSAEITEDSNDEVLKEEGDRNSIEDNTSDVTQDSEEENEAQTESEEDK